MTPDLYEPCPHCKGTTKHGGVKELRRETCPACKSTATPGFVKIGMTVGQLERMRDEHEAMADALHAIANGDPKKMLADVALEAIIETAAETLSKVNKSDQAAARLRYEQRQPRKR